MFSSKPPNALRASSIRRRISKLLPQDSWISTPRYWNFSTTSTVPPWTVRFGDRGRKSLKDCTFVFSQLVWRPISAASSSKTDSDKLRVSNTPASRATSSAKSKSEQKASPIEKPRWVPETVRPRILSMAMLKASGARMHPCRTPDFTSNHWLSSPSHRTQLTVSVYSPRNNRMSFSGMPIISRILKRASLSTRVKGSLQVYVRSVERLAILPAGLGQNSECQDPINRWAPGRESALFTSSLGMNDRSHPLQEYPCKILPGNRQESYASVVPALRPVALSLVQRKDDTSTPVLGYLLSIPYEFKERKHCWGCVWFTVL